MKKQYESPYLGVESFQLDAAIATVCSESGAVSINHYEDTCSFPKNSGQYFSYTNCQIDVTDASLDGNNTHCYHGPLLSGGITFAFS